MHHEPALEAQVTRPEASSKEPTPNQTPELPPAPRLDSSVPFPPFEKVENISPLLLNSCRSPSEDDKQQRVAETREPESFETTPNPIALPRAGSAGSCVSWPRVHKVGNNSSSSVSSHDFSSSSHLRSSSCASASASGAKAARDAKADVRKGTVGDGYIGWAKAHYKVMEQIKGAGNVTG